VLVFCNSCRHQADADLWALVESGRGEVPLTELRFRCSQCGTDRTDFVVTSRDNPQPWRAARETEAAMAVKLRVTGLGSYLRACGLVRICNLFGWSWAIKIDS
jgi:hypothetical protein